MQKRNKKALKITVICILSLLVALILAVGIAALTMFVLAKTYSDGSSLPQQIDGLSLSNWMSAIEDESLITDVAIPGSHDSGCMDMMWAYQTQNTSVKQQLECGTRYFDVRVADDNGNLRIFHADLFGVDFLPILQDVRSFVTQNPSECVLVDFQHFFTSDEITDSERKTFLAVKEGLSDIAVHNDKGIDDLTFIKSLTLAECRGKCLIFWGTESEYTQENWIFMRNRDDGNRIGSTLHSYYRSDLNTLPSKEYIEKGLPVYWNMFAESDGGIFVLQGQLTDKLYVFGPALLESKHDDNMNAYILALDENKIEDVNVVMRDYVTPYKNSITIALNVRKGIVKSPYSPIIEQWKRAK